MTSGVLIGYGAFMAFVGDHPELDHPLVRRFWVLIWAWIGGWYVVAVSIAMLLGLKLVRNPTRPWLRRSFVWAAFAVLWQGYALNVGVGASVLEVVLMGSMVAAAVAGIVSAVAYLDRGQR